MKIRSFTALLGAVYIYIYIYIYVCVWNYVGTERCDAPAYIFVFILFVSTLSLHIKDINCGRE